MLWGSHCLSYVFYTAIHPSWCPPPLSFNKRWSRTVWPLTSERLVTWPSVGAQTDLDWTANVGYFQRMMSDDQPCPPPPSTPPPPPPPPFHHPPPHFHPPTDSFISPPYQSVQMTSQIGRPSHVFLNLFGHIGPIAAMIISHWLPGRRCWAGETAMAFWERLVSRSLSKIALSILMYGPAQLG